MKRRVSFVVALLLVSLAAVAGERAARAADTLEEVRRKGVLVVGVREDVPPFGFIDRETGRIVGIDVDLASAVAKRMDVKLEVRPVTPASAVGELLAGRIDLIAAAMARTPDRATLLDFSLAYFTTSQRVLARKGTVATLRDLEGKRVGTGRNPAAGRNLREKVPSAACYFFSDPGKAVEALRKGEIDAISASGANLYGCLSELPEGEYEIAKDVRVSEESYRLAVRKGDANFLGVVNATLAGLEEAGEARKILDRWFAGKGGPAATAAATLPRATGAVTRLSSTEGRFVVLPTRGTFRPGADVTVLDPEGTPIGTGTVAGIYEDEVYVDGHAIPKGLPLPGFAVGMNYGDEEAAEAVRSQRDVLDRVRAAALREQERIRTEAGTEFERARQERTRYQEDLGKTRLMLDYQYSDDIYRYRPYSW